MYDSHQGILDYFILYAYQDSLNPDGTNLAALWSYSVRELLYFHILKEE